MEPQLDLYRAPETAPIRYGESQVKGGKMNAITYIREQLKQARSFLEGTMSDVDDEHAHTRPPGALSPIAPVYAHLVMGEDGFVNGLIRGGAPLSATSWAGKTGLSEMPPEGSAWHEWATRVRVDLRAARQYAGAVAEATDAYLATLTPDDLDRAIDLSAFGFGTRTLGWVLGAAVVGHVQSHWGEICALKGLYGGKGFPV
jgi:hypothetical protein